MTYSIEFEYERPPITANQRLHWRMKALLTKDVRALTAQKAAHIPPMKACAVSLNWIVNDKRRRDADNIVPTLKAMCDGLVDAGIVPDDTPELMRKSMPVIVYDPNAVAFMELRIEEIA
jgi:Holliday junction resolvase RusA-like endonuclease